MKNERLRLLPLLLRVNLCISAFTFGGGYVVIPMMRKNFVEKRGLLTEGELLDMAAVSQSAPGAIAVNLSALVGYRLAGLWGAAVSCVGAVLPPLVLLTAVSRCYAALSANAVVAAVLRGMQAATAALIVDLVVDMAAAIWRGGQPLYRALVPLAFAASFFLQVPVIFILLLGAALALLAPRLGLKARGQEV